MELLFSPNSCLDPSAFFLEGGDVGALLIHGFAGSPPEMRLIGDFLHEQGLTVSAPLLPGHGTTVEDMNRCRWTDWTSHVERSWVSVQSRCGTVFVGGLSMGALLAFDLAARHSELAGVIAYSPAVVLADWRIYLTPILKYVAPRWPASGESDLTDPQARQHLWVYDEFPVVAAHELLKLIYHVRRLLPQVTCPLLVIHSALDRAIHPNSARYTCEWTGSKDKELITLHNSGHGLTVDSEWEFVADKTWQFVLKHQDH